MPPSRPWTLVSPASRGIGQALARHVLQTTRAPVVATARGDLDKARAGILEGFGREAGERLRVVTMDVCDESTIASAASTCSQHFPTKEHWHLHLALVVPGLLFPEKSPQQISASDVLLTFQTNTVGPLLAIKHFSPFLPRKSTQLTPEYTTSNNTNTDSDASASASAYTGLPAQAIWTTMSARVGSISDNRLGGWYSYRASKAAVNQVTKTFDNYLRTSAEGKAMAVAMHPGTVKTELSKEFWGSVKEEKLFEKEYAAERLVEVLRKLEVERARGRCWDWKAEEVLP